MNQVRACYRMATLLFNIMSLFASTLLIIFLLKVGLLSFFRIPQDQIVAWNRQWHFRILIKVIGVHCDLYQEVKNPLGAAGILFLSNHISYLDVILLAAFYPTAFVAKKEVGSWPGLGCLVRMMSTIFVRREEVISRVQCIRSLEQNISKINYCVFPEGTTTASRVPCHERWMAGNLFTAKSRDVRIMVTSISYQDHQDLLWIDDMTLLPHLWKLFQKERIVAKIRIQEISPEELCLSDLRSSSQKLCSKVSKLCELSTQSFADQPSSQLITPLLKTQDY